MAATNGQSRSAAGTAEAARLASIGKDMPWRRWSSTERAPMGHRARGLQPRRHRLGLFPARPCAQPRLSLGRGRHRRLRRRQAAAVPRPRAVERQGPDPEGAAVRPDQQQGNHGEDVKELYYYLDGTPTHAYMRMLYKYPQAAFPYTQLVEENRAPRQDCRNSRSSTPASSTTTAISTSRSNTPRPRPTTS